MRRSSLFGLGLGLGLTLLSLLLLLVPAVAVAQLQSGNLYGKVHDQQGNALPGVTVTLDTGAAPQIQVTGAQGEFRFLGLPPGAYHLKAELQSFSTVEYPNVVVSVGRNTEVELTLTAAVEDVITVTAESPLLDERKITTGSTVSQTELAKVPTARDPWALLQQVPGVLSDRMNVGGNESGQQSTYVGPGSSGANSIWAVDGVVITDMGAIGGSPSYYDFDSFEELQVGTGGTDASVATGGVVINMVTKRGTNELRGSGRYFDTRDSLQSNTGFDDAELGKAGPWSNGHAQPVFRGDPNKIGHIKDYGAELGGPLVKEHLWFWGSYAKNDINNFVLGPLVGGVAQPDIHDNTQLADYNAKLNWQITPSNSLTSFYLRGEKTKQGRGAGPSRPQETTWDQSGPTNVYKLEDTQIFSADLFATLLGAWGKNVFLLAPEGGLGTNVVRDESFVWHNSFVHYQTERPQKQGKLEVSKFANTGNVSHELKFSAGYRKTDIESGSTWPGFGIQKDYYKAYASPDFPILEQGGSVIALSRDSSKANRVSYTNAFVQDTLTANRLTANIGVRYDGQKTTNLSQKVPANAAFPDLLPAVQYPGGGGFEWKNFTPRLGITYAIGAEHKSLLRASYSRFADQLGGGTSSWLSPLYPPSYVYLYYNDTNHDGLAQPGEVLKNTPCGICGAPWNSSYNPLHPGSFVQSFGLSSHFHAPITDEALLGFEHSLLPEFVVGVNLTYRKLNDTPIGDPLVFDGDAGSPENLQTIGRRATRNDFDAKQLTVTLPNGRTTTTTYYVLKKGVTSRGGSFLYNSDISSTFKGAALTFNKRLTNHWMLRGNVSYQDWVWNVPGNALADRTDTLPGGARDGEPVLQGSTLGGLSGSKGNVFINSKWSYNVTGLYQIAADRPWGFDVAASLTGRQGYALPYWVLSGSRGLGTTASRTVLVTGADDFRAPDLRVLDLRLDKELKTGDFTTTFSLDCFNALNSGTVLQRNTQLNSNTGNFVTEVLSPRIFRLGLRLNFR